jgi:predicted Fe-S protein YdhL (DUF1289 family)
MVRLTVVGRSPRPRERIVRVTRGMRYRRSSRRPFDPTRTLTHVVRWGRMAKRARPSVTARVRARRATLAAAAGTRAEATTAPEQARGLAHRRSKPILPAA